MKEFEYFMALASSPARRLRPRAAAARLDLHKRTLENWRRSWRQAEKEGKPELRRGPRFVKIGKGIYYEVGDLDAWKASRTTDNCLSPRAVANLLGAHPRTLENWRRTWRTAARAGITKVPKGPPFRKLNGSIWYDKQDVNEFLKNQNSQT